MVSLHSNWGYSKLTRDYQALVVNSRIPPDVPRTFRAWFASTWSRTFWDRVNWTELVRVNIVSCGSPGYQGYLIDIQCYHARHPSQHITIRSELNGEQNRRSWLTWRWHYQASSYRPWNFLGTWRCDRCWWNHRTVLVESAFGLRCFRFFFWPSPRVVIWREEMLSILFWNLHAFDWHMLWPIGKCCDPVLEFQVASILGGLTFALTFGISVQLAPILWWLLWWEPVELKKYQGSNIRLSDVELLIRSS